MTPGKYRHLARATSPEGFFVILAIDHRANLLKALSDHAGAPLSDFDFTVFKQTVIAALAKHGTAVLTDPAYGIGVGLTRGYLPHHTGLLAPLEVTHYDLRASARDVELIPGWSVGKIKRIGGDGVKLLLPYHPDDATAEGRRAVVRRLIDECGVADIPLYLEPITYSLDKTRRLSSTELTQITVAMAREFSAMGADILKLQFPVDPDETTDLATWRSACAAVNAACGATPWTLLSAGVSFDTFVQQTSIACRSGASGVIAGRAVWNEAVVLQGDARADFLDTIAVGRMTTLHQVCWNQAARILQRTAPNLSSPDWYETYDDLFS